MTLFKVAVVGTFIVAGVAGVAVSDTWASDDSVNVDSTPAPAPADFPLLSQAEWNGLALKVVPESRMKSFSTGDAPEPIIVFLADCLKGRGINAVVEDGGVSFDGEPEEIANCYAALADEATP